MINRNCIFLQIIILSIITVFSQACFGNELKGLNRLISGLSDLASVDDSKVKVDNLKLIGISKLDVPLILLNINGSIFEIPLGKEKHQYKFVKVFGSTVTINKEGIDYNLELGVAPISIKVKNPIFTSNLTAKSITKNLVINSDAIMFEKKNFQNNVKNKLEKLQFDKFEQSIVDEIIKIPGRSGTSRLGFKMPSKIVGQSINQFGLEKDDVILTINNVPIGQINDIYTLYKDETIKTYFIEVMRSEKLIMIEWYK